MAAAKDFQRQDHPAGLGDLPSTVSQPIQEESEEEDEVHFFVCSICHLSGKISVS
jgi:hypothetical protein